MFIQGFTRHTFATQRALRDPRRLASKESHARETCYLRFPCTVLKNQAGPGAVTVSFLGDRLVL